MIIPPNLTSALVFDNISKQTELLNLNAIYQKIECYFVVYAQDLKADSELTKEIVLKTC